MSNRNEFKRAVVRRTKVWEENASLSSRSFSWRRTEVHTITLECGHKIVRRGFSGGPKKFAFCKACEAGKPRVPVPLEVVRETDDTIKNPIARAMFEGR